MSVLQSFTLRPLSIILPAQEDKDHPAIDLDLHLPFFCFKPLQLLQVSHAPQSRCLIISKVYNMGSTTIPWYNKQNKFIATQLSYFKFKFQILFYFVLKWKHNVKIPSNHAHLDRWWFIPKIKYILIKNAIAFIKSHASHAKKNIA